MEDICEEFRNFLAEKTYPCVAARAAVARRHLRCMVADHLSCPKDDRAILAFIYNFIQTFRKADDLFHSAAVIFRGPAVTDEAAFDRLLWPRLQSLACLDAAHHDPDPRVCSDPESPDFSFSLGGEAFFIIGLHPASSRPARRFRLPALVFNPHAQFEAMRKDNRYEKMKQVVRQRDVALAGSINPMLDDFGKSSEVYQYSGRRYDEHWQCPLKNQNGKNKNHPASQQHRLHS